MLLKTLGGLALEPSDFYRPKTLLLLAYLAVEGAKEKRHLYELFWPEASDPANSLRSVVKLLRKLGPELLINEELTVSTRVESDITALQTATANQDAQTVSELYRGAFLAEFALPDWGAELEEWVYSTREFIAARVRAVYVRAAESTASRGAFSEAARWAEQAYGLGREELEPEELERLYPLLLAGDGGVAGEVKKQAAEFGLELRLSKDQAKERYFTATPEGQAEPQAIPHNLPRSKTSFIGRDPELVELGQLMGQGEVQLITLLGPGGIGKTRLALQLALGQLQEDNFPGGIYFVELEALSDATQIPLELAQTLGIKVKDDPLEALTSTIANKAMLLVLDNFEHLMDGALLVSALLESCPNLRVVVTSRERLNLEEEHVFGVEGLPLPKPDQLDLAEAEYNDAIRLFVQRAKRVRQDFQITLENLMAVLELCRMLEGSPLGIELAAVWMRSITPAELVSEIARSLELLESPSRNAVERHQSLRAVFEHSWQLLTFKEQAALANLTVFVGGFSREAASRVCETTIPVLTSLLDKSLLRLSLEGRYDRHLLLYEFAREKLLANPTLHRDMQQKHLAYFVGFAEAGDARMRSGEMKQTLSELQTELDNLRAALAFAVATEQAEMGLRLIVALSLFWETRGYAIEGRLAMRRVLALEVAADLALRTKALNRAGVLSIQSHPEEASAFFGEALELARQMGDGRMRAEALRGLGRVASVQGRYDLAQSHLEASLALLRDLDDPAQLAHTLNNLAITFVYQNQRPKAQKVFLEVLEIYTLQHDPHGMTSTLLNLGAVTQELGDYPAAQDYYHQSLALARSLKNIEKEAMATQNLASLAAQQEDLHGALAYHQAALEIMLRLENQHDALWTFINCANVAYRLGNFAAALRIAGMVERHQNLLNIGFPDYHKAVLTETVAEATQALGANQAEALLNEGLRMSLHQGLEMLKQQPIPAQQGAVGPGEKPGGLAQGNIR